MDPNATLKRILEIANRVDPGPGIYHQQRAELIELIQALDEWLSQGGFLPARWCK